MSSEEEVVNGGVEDGAGAGVDPPADVVTDAIWKAFLRSDVPGQRYWIVEQEENQRICHQFGDLMECLRNNVQYIEFTIYSTSSPSANESRAYLQLLREHPDVTLTIKIASMLPENADEDNKALKKLNGQERVAVEAFRGFADWQSLSERLDLHQEYTSREYDGYRWERDRQTTIALQKVLGTEDRIEILYNFKYSEAHTTLVTKEKYWAVKMPDNQCRVYTSCKLGRPRGERGLQGLLSDLGRLSTLLQQEEVITLYCSLSPVKHECQKIRRFVEENRDVSLKIKIAGLYRVHRQTCVDDRRNSCNTGRHIPSTSAVTYYNDNAQALIDIQQIVTVEAFSVYAEWQTLVNVINISRNCHGEAEFTEIDYENRYHGDASALTRKEEDLRAVADLVYLRENLGNV